MERRAVGLPVVDRMRCRRGVDSLENIWLKRLNCLHVRSYLFLRWREIGVERGVRKGVQVRDAPVAWLKEASCVPIVYPRRQPWKLWVPHCIGHFLHLRPVYEIKEFRLINIHCAGRFTVNRSTNRPSGSRSRGKRRWRSGGRRGRTDLKSDGLLFRQRGTERDSRSRSTSTCP